MNLKLFRNKNFSLLVFGEVVSLLGTQFQNFAMSLYVLKTTGSAGKFASVLALSFIPQLLLGPVSGVFVDWFDRKKIILIINTLNCIIIAALSVVYIINGGLKLGFIYAAVMLMSVNSVIFDPAVSTVFPSVLPKEELTSANSVYSLVKSSAGIFAPVMAAAIYGMAGLLPILMINSASFIIAAFFELFLSLPKVQREISRFDFHQFEMDFKEGIRYMLKEKLIFNLTIAGFIINFAITPLFDIGFLFIIKRVLHSSDMQYSIVYMILGFGELPGPFLAGIAAKRSTPVRIFMKGMLLMVPCIAFMGIVTVPVLLRLYGTNIIPLILLVVATLGMISITIVVNINLSTLFQTTVPNEMLGRVSSVLSTFCCAAIPLGQMIFGTLFDILPAFIVVFICCAIMFSSTFTFRNIRRYESRESGEAVPETAV